MTYSWCNEITGNKFSPLMDKLIKGILPICPRFSPYNRACLISNFSTIPVNIFPVTFHISLLKISRKPAHVLIIWENGLGFCFEKVVIPDANQSQYDRNIPFKRCFSKMFIHCNIRVTLIIHRLPDAERFKQLVTSS